MQTLLQDLRYGVRMLAKKPAFALVAVMTLALGIGANTAIFSVVNAVLLRALPYHNADRMVLINTVDPSGGRDGLSTPEFQDYQTEMKSLEDLVAVTSQSVNLTGDDRPDRVRGAFVSANYFKVFNLAPVLGRTFVDGEDRQGSERLVVINEKMWRERLKGDRNLGAKSVTLNGEPYTLSGVSPRASASPSEDVEV